MFGSVDDNHFLESARDEQFAVIYAAEIARAIERLMHEFDPGLRTGSLDAIIIRGTRRLRVVPVSCRDAGSVYPYLAYRPVGEFAQSGGVNDAHRTRRRTHAGPVGRILRV